MLPKQQMADFFIDIWFGSEHDYFDIAQDEMTFPQLAEIIISNYNSHAYHLLIQFQLVMLKIKIFYLNLNSPITMLKWLKFWSTPILLQFSVHLCFGATQILYGFYITLY